MRRVYGRTVDTEPNSLRIDFRIRNNRGRDACRLPDFAMMLFGFRYQFGNNTVKNCDRTGTGITVLALLGRLFEHSVSGLGGNLRDIRTERPSR